MAEPRVIEKRCWPEFFELVLNGTKSFDVRLADFDCAVGDVLVLQEVWSPATTDLSGREIRCDVTYVARIEDLPFWDPDGIAKAGGLQVIGIRPRKPSGEAQGEPDAEPLSDEPACDDCGLPYPFPLDVVLPHGQWSELTGKTDGSGLLCAGCIVKRASKLPGVTCAHLILDRFPWPLKP